MKILICGKVKILMKRKTTKVKKIRQKQAEKELKKGYPKAETLLNDKSKLDDLLESLEVKIEKIPNLGEALSYVPVFIQLVKCFITKKYTIIPRGSIVAIISALVYFVSPFDIIPDFIPGIGYIDDALVITTCIYLVHSDIEIFKSWREEQGNLVEAAVV